MKLRPNQIQAVRDINDFIHSDLKDGIVVCPTGGGKTIIISEAIKLFNSPTIVLQPSAEILEQNYEEYTSDGFEASIYSASLKQKDIGYTTFATIGSIISNLEAFKALGVQNIIMDECFPYRTPIVLEDSIEFIGDLYKKQLNGGLIAKTISFNERTGSFESKRIVKVMKNGVKKTFSIKLGHGSINCTENHKFLTNNGWKEAKNLKVGDFVLTNYEKSHTKSSLIPNEDQLALIIGGVIGDGCIRSRGYGKNSRAMSFIHGEKQVNYLKWKAEMMGVSELVERIEQNGYAKNVAYRFTSKSFAFNNKGLTDSEYAISMLNEKSLAVLWSDDGYMDKRESCGSLYTFCHDESLINKLNEKIISLGIRGTVVCKGLSSSSKMELFYIRFKKQSILDISRICCEYIHPDLSHKIHSDYRKFVGKYNWDNSNKIKGIPFISMIFSKEEEVYDIEVEDNHNYVVTFNTAKKTFDNNVAGREKKLQGFVVHNCDVASKEGNRLGEVMRFLKIKKLLGLTATPIITKNSQEGSYFQMMHRSRECLFNNIIHVTQIQDVLDYWTPIKYKASREKVDSSMLKLNSTGNDYTLESMKKFYDSNSIEYKILMSIKYLKEQGINDSLIFVPSVDEAISISNQIVGAEFIHGKMNKSDRDRIVKGFKANEIPYVVNVDVMGVGFNKKSLQSGIHARPTNSIRTLYQHLGRGVRQFEGKDFFWFLDLVGNIDKFGRIETYRFEQDAKGKWDMYAGDKKITHNGFKPKIISMSEILELEENIRSYTIMTGKYKNYNLVEVVKKDKRYLQWMASDKFEPMSQNAQKDKESAIIALKHFNII